MKVESHANLIVLTVSSLKALIDNADSWFFRRDPGADPSDGQVQKECRTPSFLQQNLLEL